MSELPREAAELLARAKAAHDPPDPEAIVRVRQRVAAVTAGTAAGGSSLDALASGKAKGAFASFTIKIWGTSLLVAALMSGLVFAWLHGRPSSVHVERNAPTPEVSAPARDVTAPAQPEVSTSEQARTPAYALPADDMKLALLEASDAPRTKGPETAGRQLEKRKRPLTSAKAPRDSLAAEVRLLKSSSDALSARNPSLALQLLDQYREAFRSPALQEEHDGLRIVARCAMADVNAPSDARQLLAKSPTNVLRESLIRSCQLRDD